MEITPSLSAYFTLIIVTITQFLEVSELENYNKQEDGEIFYPLKLSFCQFYVDKAIKLT